MEDAVARWRALGLTPAEAAERARAWRGPQDGAPGRSQVKLTDAAGRRSELVIEAPEVPAADGRYGLLISLHGLGRDWRAILGPARAIAGPHMIVVAPNAQRPSAETPFEDLEALPPGLAEGVRNRFPHWWAYREGSFPLMALDVLKAKFPIDPDRVLLLGYSMGSFGAANLALRFPDRFAGAILLAGGLSRQEYVNGRDERTRELLGNASLLPLFLGHQTGDDVVPVQFARWTRDDLRARGIEPRYLEHDERGHGLSLSDAELAELKAWVAGRRREPHPKRIEHHALGTYHGWAYWLRASKLSAPAGSFRAEVEGPNQIAIATEGVSELVLYLDPALVDPEQPLKVSLNGAALTPVRVEPTLRAVVESFVLRRDASLVFEHALRIDVAAGRASPLR
ncbi:MAG: hypothetical protein KDD82_10290 [Planctomycetes bacterium]|nr:hypothetical protein [Planctomycetota bacterium]